MTQMWITLLAVLTLGPNLDGMLQDKNGVYWFCSNSNGVYRYDGAEVTQYTTKHGLVSDYVMSVQEDSKGHLWFTTRDGISRFDGKTFTTATGSVKMALPEKLIPKPGYVYFNQPNGMCYFDGTTFTAFTIHPPSYEIRTNTNSREYGVYTTFTDRAGNVWFGTQEKGVVVYNGLIFSYIDQLDLDGGAVRTIFQDKNGTMWFGNNGGGLFRYEGGRLRNITEEQHLGNEEFLRGKKPVNKPGSLARVFAINEDRDGNIWVGTVDAGVWKYDGKTFKNYTTQHGLAGLSVTEIYKDRKGALWFVVNGTTVQQFNGRTFTKVLE